MLLPVLIAFESLAVGETCPAAVDVQARVRAILHLLPEQQLGESFLVERHEAGLYVVLKSADATTIGERTLPLEGSCDELAQAAAVVLSAWLTDVHPDFAGALPAPEPEPEPAPDAELPPAEPPPPVKPERAPPTPTNLRRVDLALGVGGDLASASLSPAALVSLGYGPDAAGVGLTAFAMLTAVREQALGAGLLRWRRWPLGVGPVLRLSTGSFRWDFSAGPVLAWLRLTGDNFETFDTHDVPTWGGFVGVRASGRGPLAPFGLLNLQIYPGDSVAYVMGTGDEWHSPFMSLGLTFGVRLAH